MKKIITNIFFIVWVIASSLVLLEITLSFLAPAPKVELINITGYDDMRYRLVENPKLIYVPIPNTGPLNSKGHRGKEFELNNLKPRWTFLGDSVFEGFGVNTDQRFSELLENEIPYEIVNIGVRGYNIWQYLEYFKLLNLHTDYLTIGLTYNDLTLHSGEIYAFQEQLNKLNESGYYRFYYSKKKKLLQSLIRFNITKYYILWTTKSAENVFNNDGNGLFNKEEASLVIEDFESIASKNNIKLSFIILPINPDSYFDDQIKLLREILISRKVIFLDLDDISKTEFDIEERRKWFLDKNDPCHLSPYGMEKLKDFISKKHGLLTGL